MKDLVVHVDSSAHCMARIELAARLAGNFGAHLNGVYGQNAFVMPPDYASLPNLDSMQGLEAAAITAPEQIEYNAQAARADEQAAEQIFRRVTASNKAMSQWYAMAGRAADVVVAFSRYADLAVVGQTLVGGEEIAAEVALRSGRPVLVVPDVGNIPSSIKRVLVAWDASREAARALNDALPLLQWANLVTVLTVGVAEQAPPGMHIGEHLKRHGIDAELVDADDAELDAGHAVLARAANLTCDLIVMGAYGHSRLRERMLGGTTHHVLKHMESPLLISH
jgi:nucleotide-binding universal stress UspA family protein